MISVQDFAGLSTATVSDALDREGLPGGLLGLAPLGPDQHLLGRAFTVRYRAAGDPPGTVGDYLDDVRAGQVVVLENAGRTDCTVWGDILTAVAHQRGVAGTVIDGVCRDVRRALDTGYPIYSRGRFMRTGKDRVEVAGVAVPVVVGGVPIRPGDLLIGDADGVVVVAWDRAPGVLAAAREIADRESGILAEALGGVSIAAARERFGYHNLQPEPAMTLVAPPVIGTPTGPLLDAAGSATAYEASGLQCALAPEFRPAWPGARCIGTALPVAAADADNLPLHWALEAARPGDVLVVDAGGSQFGYWGEVLATAALRRGVAGLVIDGGVRDTDRLAALRFAAFSTCVSIHGTGKRWPGRVGSLVRLRGTPVLRGDIVVADADGIAVLPYRELPRILAAVRSRMAKEAAFLDAIADGASTLDLYRFREFGHPTDWPEQEEQ